MRTITINKKVVKLYDSIDEMPIVNFQKYNKYLLIDSGIGSSADDIDAHITKLAKLIKANDKEKAIKELINLRQNIYMVHNEISPKNLAFSALIYEVDGKVVTDFSDEGLKAILTELMETKQSFLSEFLDRLKKKIADELETYFPSNFISPSDKESFDKLKQRILLKLEEITKGVDNSMKIYDIDNEMFSKYIPKTFDGSESLEVRYDKQFEDSCLVISQKTNADPKKMTVLQFYNALEHIKRQAEAEAKAYSRIKR